MKAVLVQSPERLKKIIDLRKVTLHFDGPMERVFYSRDQNKDSIHVAIFDESESIMACGSLLMEDETGFESVDVGRIRGMAVSEKFQGRGLGGLVLDTLIVEAEARRVSKIWCDARTKILNFYIKRGFVSTGNEFVTASGIPHYKLVKTMGFR